MSDRRGPVRGGLKGGKGGGFRGERKGDGRKGGGAPFKRKDDKKRPPKQETRQSGRDVALIGLMDVREGGAYSGLALSERLRLSNATAVEKRFATELFYGALENLIYLDYVLEKYMEETPNERVRNILRLAAYQILFLTKVPFSAACDEAVKQVRRAGMEGITGFVNAVTRGLIRDKEAGTLRAPEDDKSAYYLHVMHSMPEDIVKLLLESYDYDFVRQLLSYKQTERGACVYGNPMEMNSAAFEKWMENKGLAFDRTSVDGVYRLTGGGDIAGHPGHRDGIFSIIGEASALAALEMQVKPGMNVLDTCAAPGGKAAYMAQRMNGSGRVHAWDAHEHRVELIRATAKRLHLENIRPALRDATKVYENCIGCMDAVLIDAPCSGLGVMLNKPDVKYRVTREGILALIEMQKGMLEACAGYVRRGGALVYSTCTILPEENQRQVAGFLDAHPEYEPELEKQLFPHVDGTDGFYIARMRRRK